MSGAGSSQGGVDMAVRGIAASAAAGAKPPRQGRVVKELKPIRSPLRRVSLPLDRLDSVQSPISRTNLSTFASLLAGSLLPLIPSQPRPQPLDPSAALSLQTKHYRDRRSSILRALGQSSFVNGSHFALLWIQPDGAPECFASEAFVPKLAGWFPRALLREAQAVAEAARGAVREEMGWGEGGDEEEDEGMGEGGEEGWEGVDVFGGGAVASGSGAGPQGRTKTNKLDRYRRTASQTPDIPLHPLMTPADLSLLASLPSAPPAPPAPPPRPLPTTFTPTTLAAWYELRFAELGPTAGAALAARWFAAVDLRASRQGRPPPPEVGEERRPGWWPVSVRFREPGELVQSERTMLLVRLVGVGEVDALERSTAGTEGLGELREGGKAGLLRDIYTVAREEQQARRENGGESARSLEGPEPLGWLT